MLTVPLVTVQFPPSLIVSVTVVVIASQSFGFATVMAPVTFQSLSVTPVSVAVTV